LALIVHDLSAEAAAEHLAGRHEFFAALPAVAPCRGCFGCWLKTPGRCVQKDRGSELALLLARHDQAVFVSRLVFGGFSPAVKAAVDRSIGFILPFFRLDGQGRCRHLPRYERAPALSYCFYGPDLTAAEKATASQLASANAANFGSERVEVQFFDSLAELRLP
jgi:hypothetical protein